MNDGRTLRVSTTIIRKQALWLIAGFLGVGAASIVAKHLRTQGYSVEACFSVLCLGIFTSALSMKQICDLGLRAWRANVLPDLSQAMFIIHGDGLCAPCRTLDELAERIRQYKGCDIDVEDLRSGGRIYKLLVTDDGLSYERHGSRCGFDIHLRLSSPGGC